MHYGELKKCDIANGIGVRVTLFVSGCTNHCPDCFQPQTWDRCWNCASNSSFLNASIGSVTCT